MGNLGRLVGYSLGYLQMECPCRIAHVPPMEGKARTQVLNVQTRLSLHVNEWEQLQHNYNFDELFDMFCYFSCTC